MPCDVFTGRCEEGCESGWSGEGCQVPSVCPVGYFGINCTDHCNCPDNVGCDKVSGFCITTEGECEVGFTSDSVDMPESCNSYTGCYNLCSGTCHCRDGEDDCNPMNGSCSSGRCHPRWTGESCQIDRFQSAREKTNPGIAMFSCAISFDSPTNVEPDLVKATTGDFSRDNWETAKDPPQNISSTIINFTFIIQDLTNDSPIYCFIGDPFNKSSEFGYVKLASAPFYELPILTSLPTLVASGNYWVVISWRPWNSSIDSGDGPITSYRVYVHTEDGNETHSATLLPDGSLDTGSSRGRREVTSKALDLLEYNITGLEDGTNYEIQIAVIREGPKGEGDRGPPFSVKTQEFLW
ncbi:uncharacterized protein LOC115928746 [Strongylocentrotus purpuratus]|uniref:Fibronectin type-III domain-containing protein n=1 Tax=Strongylocentrotus purpuratus TaxID=7668 RepID=A0A7M7PMI2_STRPU|nr:uncharacterized protein LOC115928746 [Strongylocentrotus purpuratus]